MYNFENEKVRSRDIVDNRIYYPTRRMIYSDRVGVYRVGITKLVSNNVASKVYDVIAEQVLVMVSREVKDKIYY